MNYRGYKILYVDDEAANSTSFKYCFDELFDVVTAPSGDAALALMATTPMAVLLADQRMPGMSGVELCRIVRERHPDVVRVIVTAYSDVTAAVAAINAGQVSRYLFKPWREEQMAEVLRAAIEAHQLGVMTRELQVRLLQSEQQATTTYLLGRVLHELANPAATVNTNVEWIADSLTGLARRVSELPADLGALVTEVLTAARETAVASRELVGRIDRFRRGDSPAAPRSSTDLKRALDAALAIVEREIRQRAELVIDVEEVAPVAAEATQISQIVVNLLMNAVEALTTDGARRVAIRVFAEDDRAVLQVEDSGAGIAAELLPRVFEPFVSTKTQDVARGFGLAVVHEIVSTLGGDVQVTSEPGRGATFTVRLPFARPNATTPSAATVSSR
ncbi:MAG TPA: hybrid sensor histidine kinase/response regulator [Polyangia bacterium]|nr:hybrid sensor histidine kinase/response regulator [Polyangia bacterium]